MFIAMVIAAAGLSLQQTLPAASGYLGLPPSETAVVVAQLGLTPQALAASGMTAAQAALLADRLAAAEEAREGLLAAELAVDASVAEVSRLWELSEGSPDAPELQSQLVQARAAAEFAEAALAASSAALLQELTQGLPAEVLGRLATYRSPAGEGLPPALRVVPWTEEEVRQLRQAAVAVSRAEQRGEPAPPEASSILAAARSDVRVIEAEGWLATRLGDIRAALGQQ